MNGKISLYLLILPVLLVFSCSAMQKNSRPQKNESPEEWIHITINEAVEFNFQKINARWVGELKVYSLTEEGQKIIQQEYISAGDSTWNDFSSFVDFLHIYEIGPQNQIDGWAANSAQLPKRVYTFEVFDGKDTSAYSYQDPELELRDYWQSQFIVTFVTYIQDELNWVQQD